MRLHQRVRGVFAEQFLLSYAEFRQRVEVQERGIPPDDVVALRCMQSGADTFYREGQLRRPLEYALPAELRAAGCAIRLPRPSGRGVERFIQTAHPTALEALVAD